MFELAVRSGIPFISVTTDDILTLEEVMESVTGKKPKVFDHKAEAILKDTLYYSTKLTEEFITKPLYLRLIDLDSTLVLVNSDIKNPLIFDVGTLPVPSVLVAKYLADVVEQSKVAELMPAVSGLTIKTMMNVVRLASAKYGDLTPRNIYAVRSLVLGATQGLNRVDTTLPLYLENKQLRDWLSVNKRYFPQAPDKRLRPRGVLLAGSAGVGKTQGAKYIANTFGVPMYHLDLSTTLNKYVGSSEANLSRILNTLDTEAPAVLLLDEIEKLFNQEDDSGVTSRLLAQLLWWLQEHESSIFTVMTTNNINALPPELYRAGRIDEVFNMPVLNTTNDVLSLGTDVLGSLGIVKGKSAYLQAISELKFIKPPVSHAEVVQSVLNIVKRLDLV